MSWVETGRHQRRFVAARKRDEAVDLAPDVFAFPSSIAKPRFGCFQIGQAKQIGRNGVEMVF